MNFNDYQTLQETNKKLYDSALNESAKRECLQRMMEAQVKFFIDKEPFLGETDIVDPSSSQPVRVKAEQKIKEENFGDPTTLLNFPKFTAENLLTHPMVN